MFTRLLAPLVAACALATVVLQPQPAAAADARAFDGTTQYTAAGSCWEIKQRYPSSPSDRYWVVTPAMPAPMRIYCDQTTDGGGWALVARGRERWTEAGGGTVGSGTWMTDLPIDGRNGAMIAKQLPGSQIDALLNDTRVDALPDGIRLRRAKVAAPSGLPATYASRDWQEVRLRLAQRDRWSWALASKLAVASYTVDGRTTTTRQQVNDLRLDGRDDANRMFTYATGTNGYVRGFNYAAAGPLGSTSSTSYLYASRSDRRYATPFTQMFVRPRLMRADLDFGSISDAGKPAVTNRAIASSTALPNTWGVKGLGAGGTDFNATEVSAFAQIGNTMYVGGNFTKVRNNATGTEYAQPYLAAFNATTGAWISGFRPRLNKNVKALVAFDGRLVVGGQFTSVNGATRRALVTLDPTTGATRSQFRANFTQATSGAKLIVEALATDGTWLYVGGGFTGVAGGSSSTIRPLTNLARMRGSDGTPSTTWTPNPGLGIVQSDGRRAARSSVISLDLSPDRRTLYAAGRFTTGYSRPEDGRNNVAARGAAAVNVSDGTLRSWSPRYSSSKTTSHYQQAVKAVGGSVWLGGSQHSMVKYSSSLAFQRGHLTLNGGDMQAIASSGDVVYGSCHCNDWNYSDTLAYDGQAVTGFTQVDRIGYVGAWDATTGDYLPQFAPTSGTRSGEGPFALAVGTDGTLWSGGDYTSIVTTNNKAEWAGGFVRFPRVDTTPPAAPTNLRVTRDGDHASFAWSASSSSAVTYELLKDNRVVQSTAVGDVTSDRENYALNTYPGRFFVRAVDAAGNRSATTPVLRVGGSSAARRAPTASDPAPLIARGSTWTVTAPDVGEVRAPVGFGTDQAATTFDTRPGTFALRHAFTVDDPAASDTVTIRTVADDGTAIFLNGTEIGRRNLPDGPLDAAVRATATPTAGSELDWTITVPASQLLEGTNVLSAEVHPGSDDTRDLLFDLEMTR